MILDRYEVNMLQTLGVVGLATVHKDPCCEFLKYIPPLLLILQSIFLQLLMPGVDPVTGGILLLVLSMTSVEILTIPAVISLSKSLPLILK